MSTRTTNLELVKEDSSDAVDISVSASNFDKLATQHDNGNAVSDGVATGPRLNATNASAYSSGTLALQYFTSSKGNVSMPSGTTQAQIFIGSTAGSGLTYAAVGLYSVSPSDGALTLVASTASTTSGWNSYSSITLSWTSSYAIANNARYALGVLFVGTTPPTLVNVQGASDWALNAIAPRLCGTLSSQTSLPSTVADSALSTSGYGPYAILK